MKPAVWLHAARGTHRRGSALCGDHAPAPVAGTPAQERPAGKPAILRFGDEVAAILHSLPRSGPLFPNWSKLSSAHRADRFHERCKSLGTSGVSTHSYRYAWPERAAEAGYPETIRSTRYENEMLWSLLL
jgi:hypothetical protein